MLQKGTTQEVLSFSIELIFFSKPILDGKVLFSTVHDMCKFNRNLRTCSLQNNVIKI